MSRLTAPNRGVGGDHAETIERSFEVARHLTYEEATKQRRYYDRRAGAVLYSLGTLLWFVPIALWASER